MDSKPLPRDGDDDNQPWNTYRRLVLSELTRIDRSISEMNRKLDEAIGVKGAEIRRLEVELSAIKTQIAIWGSIAGLVGAGMIEAILRLVKWG